MNAHEIHVNSRSAFASLDINARESLVLAAYLLAGVPLTDREVAARLGITDLNGCRPRITALVSKGILIECGTVKCNETGRSVRLCNPAAGVKL